MKKISLIPHAEARLKRYDINRRFVIEAINNPDEVVRGKNRGELERWIAHKLIDNVTTHPPPQNLLLMRLYFHRNGCK